MQSIADLWSARQARTDADTDDLPLRLTRDQYLAYLANCLPGGSAALGRRYHAREPTFNPDTRKWSESPPLLRSGRKDRGLLTLLGVLGHLAGRHIVDMVWPAMIDRFEIDIDRKYTDTISWGSVVERLVAIARALGFIPQQVAAAVDGATGLSHYGKYESFLRTWDRHAHLMPGVMWRSSSGRWSHELGRRVPGGVRWTVFLDGVYQSDHVREVVVGLLEAGGVGVDGGYVEVWPHGESTLRLPLGRGSMIIDSLTGEPVNARLVFRPMSAKKLDLRDRKVSASWEVDDEGELYLACGRDVWHRDLGPDIELWSAKAEHKVRLADLEALLSNKPEALLPNKPGSIDLMVVEEGAHERRPSSATKAARPHRRRSSPTSNIPGPVENPGERNSRFGELLCGWYVGAGLSREDTITRATLWVNQPGHAGSLSGPSGKKVSAAMIASVTKNLDLMDRKVSAGQLTKGLPRNRKGEVLPSAPSIHTPSLIDPGLFQPGRRTEVLAALTDEDKQRLTAVTDPFLRGRASGSRGRPPLRRLEILVGSLRVMLREHGPMNEIASHWDTLESFVGTAFPKDHPMRGVMSPVTYVLRELRRLGFIGRVIKRGAKGIASTVYELPHDLRVPTQPTSASTWPSWDKLTQETLDAVTW
jgi:hypothetical protein